MQKKKIIEKNYLKKSIKINDMVGLRNHAIETLEKLAEGEIDTAEAGVTGKLFEGIISTVKAEIDYARILGKVPNIKFMGDLQENKNIIEEQKNISYLPKNVKE